MHAVVPAPDSPFRQTQGRCRRQDTPVQKRSATAEKERGAAQFLPSEGARADTPRTAAHAAAWPAAPHPVPADGTTPSGLQCLPDRVPPPAARTTTAPLPGHPSRKAECGIPPRAAAGASRALPWNETPADRRSAPALPSRMPLPEARGLPQKARPAAPPSAASRHTAPR